MTPDEQYQKTIDEQRAHLLKLQDDFNKACEAAKEKAQQKLQEIPKENKDAQEEVLKVQKEELDEALYQLKTEVDRSMRGTMKKLEAIVREKEKAVLKNLENQMANL